MSNRSKPFSSRFTMVQHRRHGMVGVVSEVPHEDAGEREFWVLWEGGTCHGPNLTIARQLYSPKDLLTEAIPYNAKGKKLMLELMLGPWFIVEPAPVAG